MSSFTCDGCLRTFEKIISDEEAMREYEEKWGAHLGEELDVLCEECEVKFNAWLKKQNIKCQ